MNKEFETEKQIISLEREFISLKANKLNETQNTNLVSSFNTFDQWIGKIKRIQILFMKEFLNNYQYGFKLLCTSVYNG